MADFYEDAHQRQLATLQAAKARCIAELETYRAENDEYSAAQELQTLATLNDQEASLQRLARNYQAQKNPPPPARLTDKEMEALSPEKMMQHPEAIEAIFSKSKYYKSGQWSDPEVARRVHEGVAEVQRRRNEGR